MSRRSSGAVDGRAILGVIALYALLLRAFLGFATPVDALDPTGGTILCAEHAGGVPTDKATADCHPCCTLAHASVVGTPPTVAVTVLRPRFDHAPVVWRPEAAIPKTGPPAHARSARGPPAA